MPTQGGRIVKSNHWIGKWTIRDSAAIKWVLPAFLVLFLSSDGCTSDCTDEVVGVLDGDTIEVLHNRHPERIRLSGIDCPEKGQAFANQRSKPRLSWCLKRNHPLPTGFNRGGVGVVGKLRPLWSLSL